MSGPTSHNRLLPCKTCPWRTGQHAQTIPRYHHQKACGLIDTTGEEDGFRQIMACHNSTEKDMFACRGYIAQEGERNINLRILNLRGDEPYPQLITAACEKAGIELHANYPEVLAKLKKDIQPRKRKARSNGE